MKKWRRLAGAIKDKLSQITAADEKFTVAIIKATSHNDESIDIENIQFIYRFIQNNPLSFKPIIRAISLRVEHTQNWTVALKCLMLLHGLFLSGITAVDSIGRLPFDLSGFGKRKSRFSKTGRFNIFVRAYFLFLDTRSILFYNGKNLRVEIIVKMQRIVDTLIRIKPICESPLVFEAMEFVINEILQINGQICSEFADFLSNIPEKSSPETELVMKIVAKSLSQREELFKYFEFCRDFGVMNARKLHSFVRITESQMLELDELIQKLPELEQITTENETEVDLEISDDDDDVSSLDLISF